MCRFTSRLSGRLADHIYAWKSIDASQVVQEWITDGIRIPFHNDCVPEYIEENNSKFNSSEYAFLLEEIKNLEIKGAIERVNVKPHCVSPIKCVPKKTGQFRLITDLRSVNSYVNAPKFTNEGINTAAELINKGDYFVETDLKDGFLHIPVQQSFRKYLGFQFQCIYYTWCVRIKLQPILLSQVLKALGGLLKATRYTCCIVCGRLLDYCHQVLYY